MGTGIAGRRIRARFGRSGTWRALGAVAACASALLLAVWIGTSAAGAEAGDARKGGALELKKLANVRLAVMSASPPGRDYRGVTLVAQQTGQIAVVRKGRVLEKPFLDISKEIATEQAEQGLLAIAVAPDFEQDPKIYFDYTDLDGDVHVETIVPRAKNPLRGRLSSRADVIDVPHRDFPNHNGGAIRFDPAGDMYLSIGDGSAVCDRQENAQNTDLLLGKILRITPGADGGYTVPPGNPFVGGPGADEVFAYGFRNPFRFSIDARSGSIAIGDVGQSAREEVDIVSLAEAKGANFGWDALEGTHRADPLTDCNYEDAQTPLPAESIPPTYEYPHTNSRCSVTGGLISRSRRLPSLRGSYVFADLCHRGLFSFEPPAPGETVTEVERIKLPLRGAVTSIEPDRRGRLVLTTIDGKVLRLAKAKKSAG